MPTVEHIKNTIKKSLQKTQSRQDFKQSYQNILILLEQLKIQDYQQFIFSFLQQNPQSIPEKRLTLKAFTAAADKKLFLEEIFAFVLKCCVDFDQTFNLDFQQEIMTSIFIIAEYLNDVQGEQAFLQLLQFTNSDITQLKYLCQFISKFKLSELQALKCFQFIENYIYQGQSWDLAIQTDFLVILKQQYNLFNKEINQLLTDQNKINFSEKVALNLKVLAQYQEVIEPKVEEVKELTTQHLDEKLIDLTQSIEMLNQSVDFAKQLKEMNEPLKAEFTQVKEEEPPQEIKKVENENKPIFLQDCKFDIFTKIKIKSLNEDEFVCSPKVFMEQKILLHQFNLEQAEAEEVFVPNLPPTYIKSFVDLQLGFCDFEQFIDEFELTQKNLIQLVCMFSKTEPMINKLPLQLQDKCITLCLILLKEGFAEQVMKWIQQALQVVQLSEEQRNILDGAIESIEGWEPWASKLLLLAQK